MGTEAKNGLPFLQARQRNFLTFTGSYMPFSFLPKASKIDLRPRFFPFFRPRFFRHGLDFLGCPKQPIPFDGAKVGSSPLALR